MDTGYVIFNAVWLAGMLVLTLTGDSRDDEEWFWITFGIKVAVLSVIQMIAGYL